MTRGEGLGNILTLFEKIQGEQRKRQEVREDRAYRSGMAKWMEEARAQEGRQQTELKFMFEQMGNLEQQYAAEQKRLTTLGLLTTDKDTSEGFRKLLSDSVSNVQKRANTLSGRMKQHSTQMERLLGTVRTQQERIGKAQETFRTYQRGFTDDALAMSIYEMGKTTEGEKGIEAMRLDSKGAKQAWDALVVSGNVTPELARDPVYKKGVINRAMGMSDKGIAQELKLREVKARETTAAAAWKRVTALRDPEAAFRLKKRLEAEYGLANIQNIGQDVTAMLDRFKAIPKNLRGPIEGRTVGQGAKFMRSNPNLTAYEDFKEFILSNISRQLGGERGVLTDKDIERVKSTLPSLADTDESAAAKIKEVLDFVDRRVIEKQKVAGLPQTGLGYKWEDTAQEEIAPEGSSPTIDFLGGEGL